MRVGIARKTWPYLEVTIVELRMNAQVKPDLKSLLGGESQYRLYEQ